MEEIRDRTGVPLVLHGGTGIPTEQIQRAISLGTSKINVNTENQMAFTKVVREVLAKDEKCTIHANSSALAAMRLKKQSSAKCANSVLPVKRCNTSRTVSALLKRAVLFHSIFESV